MSCSTNANRSAGVRESSTTSRARPTPSASSASCSGSRSPSAVMTGSGRYAPHVQALSGDDGGQPSAEVVDLFRLGLAQPQPGVLDGVVGLGQRTEHPIGHRPQPGAVLLEAFGQPLGLVHRSHHPVVRAHRGEPSDATNVTSREENQRHATTQPEMCRVCSGVPRRLSTGREGCMMTPVVDARGLTKRFGDVEALTGLDLVAEPGQVTALLGPNGAGKTTFISAVATLLRPDSGDLWVAGIDARSQPRHVGRLFGLDRRSARSAAGAVLEALDLTDAGDRLVRTYSGGMRRRLDLGASLVGGPKLLLLDEPTTGLDPRSRMELWGSIRNLVAGGTDVLLTTQYLEEADQLARHIVIVDHGQVIAAGTPDQLKTLAGRDVLAVRPRAAGDLPAVEEVFRSVAAEAPHLDLDTSTASITTDRGADQLATVVCLLDERHIAVEDIGLRRPSLDEVFLTLTGRQPSPWPPPTGETRAVDAA